LDDIVVTAACAIVCWYHDIGSTWKDLPCHGNSEWRPLARHDAAAELRRVHCMSWNASLADMLGRLAWCHRSPQHHATIRSQSTLHGFKGSSNSSGAIEREREIPSE